MSSKKSKFRCFVNRDLTFTFVSYPEWRTSAMSENGGMFAYIGEIEQFWPHFCKKWYPNSPGVLLHSFCQKSLATILREKVKLDFEFDWIYWSGSHVALFEVGMKETNEYGKISDNKISENIREKLNKALTRYIPVFKILCFYLTPGFENRETFEHFLKQHFSVVLFFPSINHSVLGENVKRYIDLRSQSSEGKFTDKELQTLEMIHFAGRSTSLNVTNKEFYFYKYDAISKEVIKVEAKAMMGFENPTTDSGEGDMVETLIGLFAFTYFCAENSDVIGNFDQGPGSLITRYIEEQRKFIKKAYELRDQKKVLLELDELLSPQQFGIILEDARFVRCAGESGSGKTAILLAKAVMTN